MAFQRKLIEDVDACGGTGVAGVEPVLSRPYFGDILLPFIKSAEEYRLSVPELGGWKTATVRAL